MKKRELLLIILSIFVCLAGTSQAATFTVNSTSDAPDAALDGVCDDGTGHCTLRAAIEETNDLAGVDTINFTGLSGTNTITIVSQLPSITEDLTITNPDPATLTVDAAPGAYRVFEIDSPGNNQTVNISGLTITGGNVSDYGGGIYLAAGDTLNISSCIVTGNTSSGGGGGIAVPSSNSTLNITNCTVSINTTTGGGGSANGGGIYNSGGTVTITNSSITGNTIGESNGGGIYNGGSGTLTIFDTTISGNQVTTWWGGGIFNNGDLTITGSTISGNSDGLGVGGILQQGTATITNTTISGNTGIGIRNTGAVGVNSTFLYSTIASNTGTGYAHSQTATFTNTIVANNLTDCTGTTGGTFIDAGWNLDSDDTCGLTDFTDLPDTDPLLGPLQDNGGPTLTHALLSGSPAIDAGDNVGSPPTDQRGITRPQDGDNDGMAISDIGAYEVPVVDLPKTGQTVSYASGDDGDIEAGVAWPTPRFTDNGDGTVTDNLTGLMWAQDANLDGAKLWADALTYVNGLNLAGYGDWRIANVNELESLINAQEVSSATWLIAQGFTNVQAAEYWSSTTYVNNTSNAWAVNVDQGYAIASIPKTTSHYVWPMRATTTPPAQLWKTRQTASYASGDDGDIEAGVDGPSQRFTDNMDGTVTDNLTGLMWAQDANLDGAKSWGDALTYVNGLNLAGYGDWRLANRKELRSLIDYSEYSPALPSGFPFINVQVGGSDFYWSSTTAAYSTGWAWIIGLQTGHLASSNKIDNRYVWPVRGKLSSQSGGSAAPPLLFGGGGGGGGGGCFIATAAYGSGMAKEVKVFQRVRDEYLLANGLGRIFVSHYYKYSPPLAHWIAKHPVMRKTLRVSLYPILELSKCFLGENPPE